MIRIPIPVWYQPYGTGVKTKVLLFSFCDSGAVVMFESGQFLHVNVADLIVDNSFELFSRFKWTDGEV